ncbi:MAG: hypothetical protein LBK28_00195 [Propionibacteriaceae bacterium]|nr:hypothetical protein [Propionibacteriaceae bacterium]
MKGSVSLPEPDWAFLDAYANEESLPSRSAAVHEAVISLRERRMARDYEAAWGEWEASGDDAEWRGVIADGLRE